MMEKLIKFKPEFSQDKLFEMKFRLNLLNIKLPYFRTGYSKYYH
jgi:hypothetical protein